MSAVRAIWELLNGSAPVTVICPARNIVAGVAPQGIVLPAMSITHISTVPVARIDAYAEFNLATSRVQVTVIAKDHVGAEDLIDVVRKACNYQRGTLGGLSVVSIVRDTVGPAFANDDAKIHFQSIDFKVTYHEPN